MPSAPELLRLAIVAALSLAATACGDRLATSSSPTGGGDTGAALDAGPDAARDGSEDDDDGGLRDSGGAPDPLGDADGDGIPNGIEELNGDWMYQPDSNETDWQNADTDGDGINDGAEDANRDGIVDEGETDPRRADTDGDGIDDGAEAEYGTDPTNADTDDDLLDDGVEVNVTGTNPLVPDSDGDGLLDGDEDRDADGEIDPRETDPLTPDTDGDGVLDGAESLPLACARVTEPDTRTIESREGDWLLVVGAGFGEAARYDEFAPDDRLLLGAHFANEAAGVYAFATSRAPTAGTSLEELDATLLGLRRGFVVRNVRIQPLITWDGFAGATAEVTLRTATELTVAEARDRVAARVLGIFERDAAGSTGPAGAATRDFVATFTMVRRSDERIVAVGGVRAADATSDAARHAMADLSDGTNLAQFGDALVRDCEPLPVTAEEFDVDFLFVVDDTASMLDDRETVANTATRFFTTLSTSLLNYRIAVVSTQLLNDEWLSFDPAFITSEADFQAQIRRPLRQSGPPGSEFGLETVANVVTLAASHFADPGNGWRRDARRIVVFLTDENDQSVKNEVERGDTACDASVTPTLEGCAVVDDTIEVLAAQQVRAYAITGDLPSGCASDAGPGLATEAGAAYIRVAFATGGSFASICAPALDDTIDAILRAAVGAASQYDTDQLPLSSTLRVVRAGALLPRASENGWDFDAANRRIIFDGDARPRIDDDLAIGYRRFVDETPDPTGYIPEG
jgi:hypothetical protein